MSNLSAAAKNVIALAAGGVDGLGSFKRQREGGLDQPRPARDGAAWEAFGARPETFSGLAGMGDLVVTRWSRQERNRRAGDLLAPRRTLEQAAEIGMVVEGLTTAPVLSAPWRNEGDRAPITDAVHSVMRGVGPWEYLGPR